MRPTIEEYLLTVAKAVATRSTCRRKVGCVLADAAGKILATGYNGPSSGVTHCCERGCGEHSLDCGKGQKHAGCSKSTIAMQCDAVHAEANALLQCADVRSVHYVAVTRAPCLECTKLLMNSSASVVIVGEASSYPQAETYWCAHRRTPWRWIE